MGHLNNVYLDIHGVVRTGEREDLDFNLQNTQGHTCGLMDGGKKKETQKHWNISVFIFFLPLSFKYFTEWEHQFGYLQDKINHVQLTMCLQRWKRREESGRKTTSVILAFFWGRGCSKSDIIYRNKEDADRNWLLLCGIMADWKYSGSCCRSSRSTLKQPVLQWRGFTVEPNKYAETQMQSCSIQHPKEEKHSEGVKWFIWTWGFYNGCLQH